MPTSRHFYEAVQAIVSGDESSLLHHIATNGVEVRRSPQNAPTIARMLLEAGAEVDALASIYGMPAHDTTLCLTVTSLIYTAGLGYLDEVQLMLATGAGLDRIVRRTDERASRFSFPISRDADPRETALLVAAMHGRLPAEWARELGHGDLAATLERHVRAC